MYFVKNWIRFVLERSEVYRNTNSKKRFDIFIGSFGAFSVRFLSASYGGGAERLAIGLATRPSVSEPDAQQVYEVLLKCSIAGIPRH